MESNAVVLEAPERMVARRFPVADVLHDGAILQVELAGICGTDVKVFYGRLPAYSTPVILGHEIVGRLVDVGPGLAARTGFAPGDRVTVSSMVPCWSCASCRSGLYRFCRSMRQYGLSMRADEPPHLLGAFSEYMHILPGSMIRALPEQVSSEAAILIEGVVANGFQWVRNKAEVRPPDVVVVQGCGPQGLGCVAVARECGAQQVIVTGMPADSARLALAKELGADHALVVGETDVAEAVRDLTGGRGADKVIDVTGSPHAWETTVAVAGVGATIVVSGLMGADKRVTHSSDHLVFNEITVKGALSKGSEAIDDAGAFVARGTVPFERMVTDIYSFDEAEHAIRAIAGEVPGTYPIKAAIRP
jgi:alcohol dehydrogenase